VNISRGIKTALLDSIIITFGDGKKKDFPLSTSIMQVVQSIEPSHSEKYLAAVLDDQKVDLSNSITKDCHLRLLTGIEPEGQQIFWHSCSHVMAQAVKSLYSDTQLGIGPAISNGYYYDFKVKTPISTEDLLKIETKMKEIVKANQPFVHELLSKEEAIALFKKRKEPFKVELIETIQDKLVSIYQNGDFIDLCRGPHVPSTGYLRHFKLLNVAGSYWHGDERNPVMQRIYGVAFSDAEKLKNHLQILEEAKKRDHRRLGKELDLFSFQEEGPGFPFWHPKGVVLYNEITEYLRNTLRQYGYQEIKTPIILNEELWHRSGHWDHYKENMYFTTIDEQTYAVKPMNCPGGLLVYKNNPHSYKELPIQLSEMGLVHRHEKSGVLHGLFRVRQFTQDDAHVFCMPDQLEDEIVKLINLVAEVYRAFGFEHYQLELSTRPKKSIGSDGMWEMAENALIHALEKRQIDYRVNVGEGAFYGPKIDYHIKDSLERTWQCGTIQVDFSMPDRFNLEYIGRDGEKHRPVMLHRAILGSVERFIGILIEHFGGAFPLWLAPVQCAIIPIGEKHHPYTHELYDKLIRTGARCILDDRSEKVGYKIRDAETKKIPYMCVIGDKEMENQTISLRKRKDGDLGSFLVSNFIKKLKEETERRDNH
jgi:threonyl-tRNA synthetase